MRTFNSRTGRATIATVAFLGIVAASVALMSNARAEEHEVPTCLRPPGAATHADASQRGSARRGEVVGHD